MAARTRGTPKGSEEESPSEARLGQDLRSQLGLSCWLPGFGLAGAIVLWKRQAPQLLNPTARVREHTAQDVAGQLRAHCLRCHSMLFIPRMSYLSYHAASPFLPLHAVGGRGFHTRRDLNREDVRHGWEERKRLPLSPPRPIQHSTAPNPVCVVPLTGLRDATTRGYAQHAELSYVRNGREWVCRVTACAAT